MDEPVPLLPGGPWTSHGHTVPGVTVCGAGRPAVKRCGGVDLCKVCQREALALQRAVRE